MSTRKPPDKILRYQELGPLHDLLLQATPPDPITGVKSITRLSRLLGMSSWGVYKWIKAGKIPPGQAVRIVALSRGRLVAREDFDDFVYAV